MAWETIGIEALQGLIKNRGLLFLAAPDRFGLIWACCYATMAACEFPADIPIAAAVARVAFII
jgi:hypothetical protein